MGSLKTVIDELAKHRLLVYFIILWGISMIIYPVCSLGSWGLGVEDLYDALWILANLIELVAGVFLMLLGVKLMNANFLEGLQTEKTLVYFLLLWAGQFFFWGLADIVSYGGIICLLAAALYIITGIILAIKIIS